MRPPDEVKRDLVRKWLAIAEEDLHVAELLVRENALYYAAIGFHSEQAAEKYLKAFLTWHQIEFPKTHDLGELLDLVTHQDPNLSESLRETIVLTSYAVDARYPADLPELTPQEARKAVILAGKVRETVLRSLKDVS